MKIENQEKVWDEIAPFWSKYKKIKTNEKESLIESFISENDLVLDIGCGSGRNFINRGKWHAIDFSKEMLKLAEKNAEAKKMKVVFEKSEADNLPFKDNLFDKVIMIATFHCIKTKEKREKTLKEIFRVLKQSGKILITVWNKNSKRWKNKPKEKLVSWNIAGKKVWRYYYLYTQEELINELEKTGFKIIKSSKDDSRNIVIEAGK